MHVEKPTFLLLLVSMLMSFSLLGQPPAPTGQEEIFRVVEEMPRFYKAECEAMTDENLRGSCAQQALLEFIYRNVKYPLTAKENRVVGTVVVTFVVETDGTLSGIRVVRDIGSGCGEEAARVVELSDGQWVPGVQRGQLVRVQFNLPVKYSMGK